MLISWNASGIRVFVIQKTLLRNMFGLMLTFCKTTNIKGKLLTICWMHILVCATYVYTIIIAFVMIFTLQLVDWFKFQLGVLSLNNWRYLLSTKAKYFVLFIFQTCLFNCYCLKIFSVKKIYMYSVSKFYSWTVLFVVPEGRNFAVLAYSANMY